MFGELEHIKIKTRLIRVKLVNVMGEWKIYLEGTNERELVQKDVRFLG